MNDCAKKCKFISFSMDKSMTFGQRLTFLKINLHPPTCKPIMTLETFKPGVEPKRENQQMNLQYCQNCMFTSRSLVPYHTTAPGITSGS